MTDILNARTPAPAPTPDILSTLCHHLATGDRPVRTETIAAAVAEVEGLRAALEAISARGIGYGAEITDTDRADYWSALALRYRGRYVEHTPGGTYVRRPGALYFRRATAAHRVELIGGQPVWTLFLTGPKVREWGFLCPKGWRHWDHFVAAGTGSGTGASVTGVGCGDAT